MADTVNRLKQYWEQYRNNQRKIKYELFPFHQRKGKKTKKLQPIKVVVFLFIKYLKWIKPILLQLNILQFE